MGDNIFGGQATAFGGAGNSQGTMADAAKPRSTTTSFIMTLVEAKPAFAALVSGAIGAAALGLDMTDSIQFGCLVAAGTSFGDAVLTLGGVSTQVQTYMPKQFGTWLDPSDFLGGGVGTAVLGWATGVEGRPLAIMAAAGAVGAGLAPMISAQILSSMK